MLHALAMADPADVSDAWSDSSEQDAAPAAAVTPDGSAMAAAQVPVLDREGLQMRTGPSKAAAEPALSANGADDCSSNPNDESPLAIRCAADQSNLTSILTNIHERHKQSGSLDHGAESADASADESADESADPSADASADASADTAVPFTEAELDDVPLIGTIPHEVRESLCKRLNKSDFLPPMGEGTSSAERQCSVLPYPTPKQPQDSAFLVIAASLNRARSNSSDFNSIGADMIVESAQHEFVCTCLIFLHGHSPGTRFALPRLAGVASTNEWHAVLFHQALGDTCTLQPLSKVSGVRQPNFDDLKASSPFYGTAGRDWLSGLLSAESNPEEMESLSFMPFSKAASAMQEWNKIPAAATNRRRGRLPGLRSSSKIEETEQAERFADGSVCKVPKLRNRMVVVNVDTTSSSLR